jgi:site-specific recombinase XerD
MGGVFHQPDILELVRSEAGESLTFQRAIELFETVYMASRNLTERTRVEYKTDVEQLASFLNAHGSTDPTEVSLSHLQAFLAELDAKGLTGVTRRRKTASIRTFFAFLTASGFIPHNPTLQLVPPQREFNEPRYLTSGEYQALLQACSHDIRDAAIIELLLQTGIRLSEIARLTIHDIELPMHINRDPANTGTMFIQGKERRQRTLPLNFKACRALKEWLSIRPDVASPALFVTKFRAPMRPRSIEEVVAKYLKVAGIERASVHSLRHTFGTHHVLKGTDLRTIQEAMGHADLKTTSIYVSMAKEALKRDLQNHAL